MANTPATILPQSQSPVINNTNYGTIWQAALPGLNSQASQQAVQQQLAIMAKHAANKRYVSESLRKVACVTTNGSTTQTYVNGVQNVFSLANQNNAFCFGVIIRTSLAYTLAAGTGATYGLTAAGSLGIFDTIEVVYGQSQIKIRPLHLRQLALMGAMEYKSMPSIGSTDGGGQDNSAYLDAYLSPTMPTATGAQTYVQDLYLPFNVLKHLETRGLLPVMPGETTVQVKCNPCQSLFGPHPVFNSIYATGGTGNAISAVSGTITMYMMYYDGEILAKNTALAYDMSVLDGTIQMQPDAQFTSMIGSTTAFNVGGLNIIGQHQYLMLLVVDANQSNAFTAMTNINYIDLRKDIGGANVFWRYGTFSNINIQEFFFWQRALHANRDLDPGIIMLVQAPITGTNDYPVWGGDNGGNQYLSNDTDGWPGIHYAVGLNSINGLGGGVTAFIEPFTIFVNPVGLTPV